MTLSDILKRKDTIEDSFTLLGEGGYAKVFLIDEERVLKISDHKSDGFRHIASLSVEQRQDIGFVEIFETFYDEEQDNMYFLTERLFPLSFDTKQCKRIKEINSQLWEGEYSFDFNEYNIMEQNIIKKILLLKTHMPSHLEYDWDIHPDNIMVDKKGNIKLSDPVAECISLLSEFYIPEETIQINQQKDEISRFLDSLKLDINNHKIG